MLDPTSEILKVSTRVLEWMEMESNYSGLVLVVILNFFFLSYDCFHK